MDYGYSTGSQNTYWKAAPSADLAEVSSFRPDSDALQLHPQKFSHGYRSTQEVTEEWQ